MRDACAVTTYKNFLAPEIPLGALQATPDHPVF
jgi:hypothetical protein